MYRRLFLRGNALACALATTHAVAQTAAAPSAQPAVLVTTTAAAPLPVAAPACTDCVTVPALTPIRVEVMATLGSKLSKTGDTFPLRLIEPIVFNGKILVPAGTTGMGEVVHAKGSGGSGAGGELVIAARYLDLGSKRVLLRSLVVNASGESRIGTANTLGVAGAVVPAVAIVGLFMKGKQSVVASGTHADAKLAEAFTISAAEFTAAPPLETAVPVVMPASPIVTAAAPAPMTSVEAQVTVKQDITQGEGK